MSDSVILTDANGRALTLRTLNVLDQYRLAKAVGPAGSGNEAVMSLATCAAMVAEIDGNPVPFPTTDRGIEAAIGRLGDAGYAALIVHMRKLTAEAEAAAEAAAAAPLARSA